MFYIMYCKQVKYQQCILLHTMRNTKLNPTQLSPQFTTAGFSRYVIALYQTALKFYETSKLHFSTGLTFSTCC